MKRKVWTKYRRAQLQDLHTLLVEARTINHGSSAVSRILRCEKLASKLLDAKLTSRRYQASFMNFLIELSGEE